MLLESYEDDFSKYSQSVDLALMQEIFRNLSPMACKKVKYVNFSREVSSREVKNVLNLFKKAMLCNAVHASKCEGVPLFSNTEEGVWKELFLDVGLMNRACGVDWMMLERMDEIRFVNEGVMAEQFVGQHLLYRRNGSERPQLAYWLREGGKNNAEVDFVVSEGSEIFPIEVKAGKSGTLKSLRELILAKGYRCAVRYDGNQASRQRVAFEVGDVRREYDLVSLPLYAVPFAEDTFMSIRSV
jgi:predicted AAA+ superfamily ATPase